MIPLVVMYLLFATSQDAPAPAPLPNACEVSINHDADIMQRAAKVILKQQSLLEEMAAEIQFDRERIQELQEQIRKYKDDRPLARN